MRPIIAHRAAATCTICSDDTDDVRFSCGCIDARRPAAADDRRLPPADDARQLAMSDTGADARRLADARLLTETGWLSTAETRQLGAVSVAANKLCLELVEPLQHADGRSNTCAVHKAPTQRTRMDEAVPSRWHTTV